MHTAENRVLGESAQSQARRSTSLDVPHNVWYYMSNRRRVYISIYFSDALSEKRKKRDITLALDPDDELYSVCRRLGSSGIKELIGVHSYEELVERAKAEDRPLSNYMKHRLRASIEHGEENTSS